MSKDLILKRADASLTTEQKPASEFSNWKEKLKEGAPLGEYWVSFKFGSVLVKVETEGVTIENILYFALGRLTSVSSLVAGSAMSEVKGLEYRPFEQASSQVEKRKKLP